MAEREPRKEAIGQSELYFLDPDEDIVHQAHHQYSPVNEVDLNGSS